MSARIRNISERLTTPDMAGVVDRALEIATQRANTLRQLRDALLRGDDAEALSIARKVCGLDDKKVSRIIKG